MGLPKIIINFTQKATSAIARSAKGVVCLVVADTTAENTYKEYSKLSDVDSEDYTAANYLAITDAFHDMPTKVYVVRMGDGENLSDVESIVDTLKFNWMACISSTDQDAVVAYVKARNLATKTRKVKAVVYNATAPDDMHIVNFTNTTVKYNDENGTEVDGWKFLARLAGLFAVMPFTMSGTYYEFDDVESVAEPADVDDAIDAGELVIINDYGEPKIGRAVNSLQTISTTITDDMKKITVVEGMDLIQEDIATTFKEDYIGKYKNKYDNQCIFITAVNAYFRKLQEEEVLDDEYNNLSGIDVEAQRQAWIDSGKTEAADWDEAKIKKMTYRSNMFLSGNVKILDAIEDLNFEINMA